MAVRVPPRLRIAAAGVVAVGALAGLIALVLTIRAAESGSGRLTFAATSPAGAPFEAFSQARVSVGSRCLRVLVALNPSQRVQGLRGVRALAPYDGMVFANPADTTAAFTMADTPRALDITWFSARGEPLDHAHMEPCPGSDATCPEYASRRPYRYALERPSGSASGSGALGACSS